MKRIFSLTAVAVLFAISCNKQDDTPQEPELPALTQEGKNILACRVNGVTHVYSGKGSFGNENGVSYFRYPNNILLYADEDALASELEIIINDSPSVIRRNTTYFFSTETSDHQARYFSDAANPYFITRNGSGWIRFVRVDSAIAAGTFEFTAYFNNDSVKITEGRFDIAR